MDTTVRPRHLIWAVLGFVAIQGLWLLVFAIRSKQTPLWSRVYSWDAGWYATIVDGGYSYPHTLHYRYSNMAFFPWLPTLGRLGKHLGMSTPVALEVAAVSGSILATVMIVLCVARATSSPWVGVVTVWLWSVAPRSHVLVMPYTEGWFTAACATALYGVLCKRWWVAAFGAAVAGATRPTAVALIAALALGGLISWWAQRRTGRDWPMIRSALAGAVAGSATYFGFLLFLAQRAGRWDAYADVQATWHAGVASFDRVWRILIWPPSGPIKNLHYGLLVLLGMIAYALLIAWMMKRGTNIFLVLYSLGVYLLTASAGYFWVKLRYSLPIFPVWIAVAHWLVTLSRRWQVAIGAAWLCTWLVATLHFVWINDKSP